MEILLFVGIVQALFACVFLLSKPKRVASDMLLAVWMIFLVLPMISGAAIRLWPDVYIPILRSDLVYPLTYGPFLWFYMRALTGEIDQLSRWDWLHFLPFVGLSIIQLVTGWGPAPPNPEGTEFHIATRVVGAVNLCVYLAYALAVVIRLKQHGRTAAQHFSALPNRVTLVWLQWLTAAISAVFFLLFVASLLSLPELLKVHLPAQVVIILVLSFFGLRQTQVFDPQPTGDPNKHPPEPDAPSSDGASDNLQASYSRSGLTKDRADRIQTKLDRFMKSDQPYLSADLTISELARQMAVSRHHLTEVISTRHNKSFYVFVNEYRVEAVKQAMMNPKTSEDTILDLAYASGFNSKSPFNTAFKRATGMTPSQYRNQL